MVYFLLPSAFHQCFPVVELDWKPAIKEMQAAVLQPLEVQKGMEEQECSREPTENWRREELQGSSVTREKRILFQLF